MAAQMSQTFGAVTRASVLCSCPPLLPSEWAVRARCDSSTACHSWTSPELAPTAGPECLLWPTTRPLSVPARALTHAEGGARCVT